MNFFRKLPRIPRASGVEPGPITPASWNAMADAVEELEKRIEGVAPKDSVDIGWRRTAYGGVTAWLKRRGKGGGSSAGCTALLPSLALDGSDWKLTISSGISGSVIPDYAAGNLSDTPPPSTTITAATKLWLVVEWEPGSDSADGIYWITSGGSLVSSEFQVSDTQPSETAAEVAEDGTITNGIYAFLWADITAVDTTFSLAANRCGNHQFTFCAPDSLKLMFD